MILTVCSNLNDSMLLCDTNIARRMNNSNLLHVSWDRWEHLEGKLVCSLSRTRQLLWSCPREHNLIDCVCQVLLLPSLVSVRGSCLGKNKTSVSFSPICKTGFIVIHLPVESALLCCFNEGCCASNCLHSCALAPADGLLFTIHWQRAEFVV